MTSASVVTEEMRSKPFYQLTEEMFHCVSKHNFDRLAQICDDDFGIIDINTTGGSEIIRDRKGWENWFSGLFVKLSEMKAETWSEITNYEAVESENMGYGVVDFDQLFIAGDQKLRFSVIATIIWKKVEGTWKESRYHSSLIKVEPFE